MDHHQALHDYAQQLWDVIEGAIDRMSVTQTAAIGGTGSMASLAVAVVPDSSALDAYLHVYVVVVSAIGATLSLALPAYKAWLEFRRDRRERAPKDDPFH